MSDNQNVRQISLYEMKPVYIAGDSSNIIDISQKINNDNTVLEEIERDYSRDKRKYRDEYLNAKINHLKNQYLYGWLILKKYFEESTFTKSELFPNHQKIKLREKGWMLPQQFINVRIQTSENNGLSIEDLYIKYFDKYFDKLFNYNIGAENSRVDECYKQAIFNYKNGKYYSCAVSLFPIIESYHQYINKFNEESFYIIKNHLTSVSIKMEQISQSFSEQFEYYVKLVEQLNDLINNRYFNRDNSRKEEPEIINRNRLMHGLFMREVSQKDCLQLFCVLSNMVVIKVIFSANELMINTSKQFNIISKRMNNK